MANGYKTGNAGPNYKGSYFEPQPVGFSSAAGMRSIDTSDDAPGVYEGVSTTAANGTDGYAKDFVPKNT